MINIALPKGRLGEKVYQKLASAGYASKDILSDTRKLVFTSDDASVSYFWVKPSDVAIYVEKGAADVGVVGKDILLEYKPDVYEILDLDMGKCKMAVAAKNGYVDDKSSTLKVATKFINIAKDYYEKQNRQIELIKLHGSIELAPILGMSDVIVDIVETGKTLKENDLSVIADICYISTRLIANKASYKFKKDEIDTIKERLK